MQDSNNYLKVDNISDNINYKLNNEKSNCIDGDNYNQDIIISYYIGVIDINTNSKSYCEIYFNVEDEYII